MHLMKQHPPAFLVAQPVPPIEEERTREPADESFGERQGPRFEIEKRYASEQMDPKLVGGERDADLTQRDHKRANIPARRVRQFAARPHPLQDQERRGGERDGQRGDSERRQWKSFRVRHPPSLGLVVPVFPVSTRSSWTPPPPLAVRIVD